MAIEHVDIADGERHEPKGISTATSGQVYVAAGDAVTGAWARPNPFAPQVIVQTAADLPAAVSNVRTLLANTIYVLDGTIDIGADRLVLAAKTTIRGHGAQYSKLLSSNTGNLITATADFNLHSFEITAASSTIFACTGDGAGPLAQTANISDFTVQACSGMGTFTDWYAVFWQRGAVVSSTTPLIFAGSCVILILELVEWIYGYSTAIDLGAATFNTCSIFRCGFGDLTATAGQHIDIAAASANINATKTGRITFCTFSGSATAILNYTVAELQWDVFDNLGQADSSRDAHGYMHTTTATTISLVNTPYVVTGSTNWANDAGSLNQFTMTTGGRFTYTGLVTRKFLVQCIVNGTHTGSPGAESFIHTIAKNGTPIDSTRALREYDAGTTGVVTCGGLVTLASTDYLEVWVENITGTKTWSSEGLNMIITEG